jgi:hypothetical protein
MFPKKLAIIASFIFATFVAKIGFAGVDQPHWVRGEQLRTELNQEFGPRAFQLDILDLFGIHGGEIESLYLFAAGQVGQDFLRVDFNGRTLSSVTLRPELQLVQVPIGRRIGRNDRLELSGRGRIYVTEVGMITGRVHGGPTEPGLPPRAMTEFRGAYEQVDVAFEGADRLEVQRNCLGYLRGRTFSYVDDIKLFTRAIKTSSFLTPDTFCAWAALNSREIHRDREPILSTDLVYEQLPIEIRLYRMRDLESIATEIEALAPSLQVSYVDDLKRDAETFKLSQFLNAQGAKAFLLANLPLAGLRLKSVGSVENFPLRLEGSDRDEIRNSCLKIMDLTKLSYVDDIVVNGKKTHSSHFLDVQEICMIYSTNAE